MFDLESIVQGILKARDLVPVQRSILVAITGIDASGKGYITAQIVEALQVRSIHVAAINVDGWLNLPDKRFDPSNPAAHFYRHAVRFNEMFSQLIFPLRDPGSFHS